MILPMIRGLEFAENQNTGDIYYFNEKMLKDNVFIKYKMVHSDLVEVGTRGHMQSIIEVACIADYAEQAGHYVMYWDNLLEGIQLYRVIKDIVEIYRDSTYKNEFISYLEVLSVTYAEGTEDRISDIKKEMELIALLAD